LPTSSQLVRNFFGLPTSWQPGFPSSFQLVRLVGCGLKTTQRVPHYSDITMDRTRKPSWCWHTRATQKRWKKFRYVGLTSLYMAVMMSGKKFLHFEVITSSSQVGNPVFIVI